MAQRVALNLRWGRTDAAIKRHKTWVIRIASFVLPIAIVAVVARQKPRRLLGFRPGFSIFLECLADKAYDHEKRSGYHQQMR